MCLAAGMLSGKIAMGNPRKVGVVSFGSSARAKRLFHGADEMITSFKWADEVINHGGDRMVLRLTVETEQSIRRYMYAP